MAFCRYKFSRLLYTNIRLVVWYDGFLSGGILSDYDDGVLSNDLLSLSSGFMAGGYLSGGFLTIH